MPTESVEPERSESVESVESESGQTVPRKTSVEYVDIRGIKNFRDHYDDVDKDDPPTFYFFIGTKMRGVSWCKDTNDAEPIVKNVLADVKKHIVFVYVDVGNREYWKDPQCPFRTDKRTKLMVIPTIIKWNGVQRLEGSQCSKPNLLTMLFEEE